MPATSSRLQARDLFKLSTCGDIQVSPAADKLAFVNQQVNPETNSYDTFVSIVDLEHQDGLLQASAPRRLTSGTSDASPRWSPTGQWLAFTRKVDGERQIFALPLAGGEARQLTHIKGGCNNPAWSPAGKRIAFTTRVNKDGIQSQDGEGGDEKNKDQAKMDQWDKKYNEDVKVITRPMYKSDGFGFFGDKRSQVGVISFDNGEAGEPLQVTSGEFDHSEPAWSPDGQWLSFLANRASDADYEIMTSDVWVIPTSQLEASNPLDQARQLTSNDLGLRGYSWSPDSQHIACQAVDPSKSGYANSWLHVLDLSAGESLSVSAARNVSASLDRPLGDSAIHDMPAPGSAKPRWSADGQSVYMTVSDGGRVHVYCFQTDRDAPRQLTTGDWCCGDFDLLPTSSGDQFVLQVNQPLDPAQVWLTDGKDYTTIAAPNQEFLSGLTLSTPGRFQFQSADGTTVDGWAMPPADGGSEPSPTILEIHGGPMGMYGDHFFLEFQALAAAGYGVVYTNPRGSLGYGESFCSVIKAQWGDKDYADCMAGIDHASEHFSWVDRDRLGVAGGSYGGWMVNWVVGHTDRFQAAVTMRSVVNRMSAIGTADFGIRRIEQYGPPPWEDPTPYLEQSPLPHADNIHTPLLIEHQENDYRCPIEQAEQLYAALKYLRREVKFVRYPGEFHGMSRNGQPWHRVYRLGIIVDWFDEWLKA